MSITFIGLGNRSSGKVRGKQLIDAIDGSNFFDLDTHTFFG